MVINPFKEGMAPLRELTETPVPTHPLEATDAGRLLLERIAVSHPKMRLSSDEAAAAVELIKELEGVPLNIEHATELMDRLTPSAVLNWLRHQIKQPAEPASQSAISRVKYLFQKGAGRVRDTAGATAAKLGRLLQGIANVATDRRQFWKASAIGHASLLHSEEAGDELGFGASMRQLARLKW